MHESPASIYSDVSRNAIVGIKFFVKNIDAICRKYWKFTKILANRSWQIVGKYWVDTTIRRIDRKLMLGSWSAVKKANKNIFFTKNWLFGNFQIPYLGLEGLSLKIFAHGRSKTIFCEKYFDITAKVKIARSRSAIAFPTASDCDLYVILIIQQMKNSSFEINYYITILPSKN